jgi:CPA2 family monovalent cation:H+ antiporter-2
MNEPGPETRCGERDAAGLSGHAIVAGYGIPGRAAADQFCRQGMAVCVIELNSRTVERVSKTSIHNLHVIVGDVSDEATLRGAGIERAAIFAVTVPVDAAVLEAVRIARRLSPKLHIMARCRYISTALEATRRGADEVVSEEQVVAQEFSRLISARGPAAGEAGNPSQTIQSALS